MRILFTSLLFIGLTLASLSPATANAQSGDDDFEFENYRPGGITIARSMRSEGIDGHPYMTSEFISGTIINMNGRKIENIPLRYVPFTDQLQIKRGNMEYTIEPVDIKEFSFRDVNRVYVFRTGFESAEFGIQPDQFMEVVAEINGSNYLMRHEKIFVEANFNPTYDAGTRYDSFRENSTLYVIRDGGDVEMVRLRRRAILRLFGDYSSQVRSYAFQNTLRYNDADDVARLFQFYSTLRN